MRLRALAHLASMRPSESAASALVRERFATLRLLHTAALASGVAGPLLLVADHRCDVGRAVAAANGVTDPRDVCLFTANEAGFLASFATSTPEKVAAMRRAVAALPVAGEDAMRVIVFTGGNMTFLPYTLTAKAA